MDPVRPSDFTISSSRPSDTIHPPTLSKNLEPSYQNLQEDAGFQTILEAKKKLIEKILNDLTTVIQGASTDEMQISREVQNAQDEITDQIDAMHGKITDILQKNGVSENEQNSIWTQIRSELLQKYDAGDLANWTLNSLRGANLSAPTPTPLSLNLPPPPLPDVQSILSNMKGASGAKKLSALQNQFSTHIDPLLQQKFDNQNISLSNLDLYANQDQTANQLKQLCDAFFACKDWKSASQIYQMVSLQLQGASGESSPVAQHTQELLGEPSRQGLTSAIRSTAGPPENTLWQVHENLINPQTQWSASGANFMTLIDRAITQLVSGSGKIPTVDDLEAWITSLGDPSKYYTTPPTSTDLQNIINALGPNSQGDSYTFSTGSPQPPSWTPPQKTGYLGIELQVPPDTPPSQVHILIHDNAGNFYNKDGQVIPSATIHSATFTADQIYQQNGHYYFYVSKNVDSGNIFYSSAELPNSNPAPGSLANQGIICSEVEFTNDPTGAHFDITGVDEIGSTCELRSHSFGVGPGNVTVPFPDQVSGTTQDRLAFLNTMKAKLIQYATAMGWSQSQIDALIQNPDDPSKFSILAPKKALTTNYYKDYLQNTLFNSGNIQSSLIGLTFEGRSLDDGSVTIPYTLKEITQENGNQYMHFTGGGTAPDGSPLYNIYIPLNLDGIEWLSGGTQNQWQMPPPQSGPPGASDKPYIYADEWSAGKRSNVSLADLKGGQGVPCDLVRDLSAFVNLGLSVSFVRQNNLEIGPSSVSQYAREHGTQNLLYQTQLYDPYERAASESGWGAYAFDYDDWTGRSGTQASPWTSANGAYISGITVSLGNWDLNPSSNWYTSDSNAITNYLNQHPDPTSPQNKLAEMVLNELGKYKTNANDTQFMDDINSILTGISNKDDIYLQYPGLQSSDLSALFSAFTDQPSIPPMTQFDQLCAQITNDAKLENVPGVTQQIIACMQLMGSNSSKATLANWIDSNCGPGTRNYNLLDDDEINEINLLTGSTLPPHSAPPGPGPGWEDQLINLLKSRLEDARQVSMYQNARPAQLQNLLRQLEQDMGSMSYAQLAAKYQFDPTIPNYGTHLEQLLKNLITNRASTQSAALTAGAVFTAVKNELSLLEKNNGTWQQWQSWAKNEMTSDPNYSLLTSDDQALFNQLLTPPSRS